MEVQFSRAIISRQPGASRTEGEQVQCFYLFLLLQNSDHEWLHSVGDDLSNIVGERNQTDIKKHLRPLVENYPDFR